MKMLHIVFRRESKQHLSQQVLRHLHNYEKHVSFDDK